MFKGKKFLPSKLAYILSVVYTQFNFKPLRLDITIDNQNFSQDSMLIATSNGKCYGGGFYITPNADICDGYLDICTIKKSGFFKFMSFLPKALRGNLDGLPEVSFFRGKEVHVSCDKEFTLNNDGELLKSKEVHFEIVPNGIQILKPRK